MMRVVILLYLSLLYNVVAALTVDSRIWNTTSMVLAEGSHNITHAKQRRMQQNGADGGKIPYHMKKVHIKASKLSQLVQKIEKVPGPTNFSPEPWGQQHNPNSKHAVFAAAMATTLMRRDVNMFCKTLRKTGYTGDIVIAVLPGSTQPFLDALKVNNAIVYTIVTECTGNLNAQICNFPGQEEKFSINMIRFHLYEWWARLYSKNTQIMLSDFRDVFFQSNPFVYKPFQWAPEDYQLTVFQEAHPNKVIRRCPFNSGWIRNCYGEDALKKIGSNTVSCSGVTIGKRDGIVAYTYLMTQQLNPMIRSSREGAVSTNDACASTGMDQVRLNVFNVYAHSKFNYLRSVQI